MAMVDFQGLVTKQMVECKKHTRYQRYEFWSNKTINYLLLAIQQGYVPVGKEIRKVTLQKRK